MQIDGRTAPKYAAFISYRHRADRDLAVRLQNGIERFATEQRQGRTVRVFRDDASLGATPNLWQTLTQALAESGWLIVLASPESAHSEWVGRELDEWHRLERSSRLIIVVTRGTLTWSSERGGYEPADSTALHPRMGELVTTEPRTVDARGIENGKTRHDREAAFESVLADVVSTVREVDKDTIRGEHLAIQRRAVRRARIAVVTLALLTVLALVAGGLAWWQRDVARTQAAIATARALAVQSDQVGNRDPILASHLALAAYRLDPSAPAAAAVLHAYERTVDTERFLEFQPDATGPAERKFYLAGAQTLAVSPDARFVAVGGYGGTVRVWDGLAGRPVGTYPANDNGIAGEPIFFSVDGRRVATTLTVVSVPDGAVLFTAPDGAEITTLSPDGGRIALWDPSRGGGFVVDMNSTTLQPQLVAPGSTPQARAALINALASPDQIAYERVRPNDENGEPFAYTAVADGAHRWAALQGGTTVTIRSLTDGTELARATLTEAPGHGDALAMSTDGSTVLVGDDTGGVIAFDGGLGQSRPVTRLPGQIRSIAVTPDGSHAVIADSSANVVQVDLRRQGPFTVLPGTVRRYHASSDEPVLTPSPDGRLLVIGDGTSASLWSMTEQRELARLPVEPPVLSGSGPVMAFSADGARIAVRGAHAIHMLSVPELREIGNRPVPTDPAQSAPIFTELLGPGADLSRSDRSDDRELDRWRSPSGRTEVTDDRITHVDSGDSVPLAGGSGPVSDRDFAFADADALVVESVLPTRDSEIFRNRLLLWDRASGSLLGQWEEPHSVVWPGDQAIDLVVAGGTTALTIRPDGSIGQWTVSPQAWVRHLCEVAGEPSAQERQDQFPALGDEALCTAS